MAERKYPDLSSPEMLGIVEAHAAEMTDAELSKVQARINAEAARRAAAKVDPGRMTQWEYQEWACAQIAKGEAAKKGAKNG